MPPIRLSLTSLPPEVLDKIIHLASLDGRGRTARALRLVSRYLAALAAPYRFHCITVPGPDSVEHLTAVLAHATEQQRRNIRHLMVSDVTPTIRELLEYRSAEVTSSVNVFSSPMKQANVEMRALMGMVSASLETLALLIYDGSSLLYDCILSVPYPSLRYLSLHVRTLALLKRPGRCIDLPRLEELHLSLPFASDQLNLDMTTTLLHSIRAPLLASVQLSGLTDSPLIVSCLLQLLLDDCTDPDHLPLSIMELTVRPVSEKSCTESCETRKDAAKVLICQGRKKLVFLPPVPPLTYARLRHEWVEMLWDFDER